MVTFEVWDFVGNYAWRVFSSENEEKARKVYSSLKNSSLWVKDAKGNVLQINDVLIQRAF